MGGLSMKGLATAAGLAAMAAGFAGPAVAGMCELKVHRSALGEKRNEADATFKKGEQFQVCFRATKDGYVTLWDQIPLGGEVERLVPGEFFTGDGTKAAKVKANEVRCFGDGSDGYYLAMDPDDGDGSGLMWLVFTDEETTHPEQTAWSTPKDFADQYQRFGAGSVKAAIPQKQEPEKGCSDPQTSLQYLYGVR